MVGLSRGAGAANSYNSSRIFVVIFCLVFTLEASFSKSLSPSRWFGGGKSRSNQLPLAAISASMLEKGGVPIPPTRPRQHQESKTNGSSTAAMLFGDKVVGSKKHRGGAITAASTTTPALDVAEEEEETSSSAIPSLGVNLPTGMDPRLLKPHPILLGEGPDFRFEFVSQCELPTDRGLFHLRAYRYTKAGKTVEPVVLFQGDVHGQRNVLVRVHDQCLTSEVLGSKRCDCKEQLELAMDRIAEGDGGMIIYLPQEGRGIGLANKVAAYNLQEKGLDTVDANLFLGFGDDERTYDYVPYIIKVRKNQALRLSQIISSCLTGTSLCPLYHHRILALNLFV